MLSTRPPVEMRDCAVIAYVPRAVEEDKHSSQGFSVNVFSLSLKGLVKLLSEGIT